MKKILRFGSVVIVFFSAACSLTSQARHHFQQVKAVDSLSVATIFKDLGTELQYLKSRLEADKSIAVTIKEADLILDNVTTDAASGGLSLLIFSPGYSYTSINERTIVFSLLSVDKAKLPKEPNLDFRGQNYRYTVRKTDSLSTLIYHTAETLSQVPLILDNDPKKMTQKTAEIDIKFSIDQNYSLELKPVIMGIGGDIRGAYDDANTQVLKITFSVK